MSLNSQKTGRVYLVGAGPGDKGLLTLKAAELLSQADVVYYDNLVNAEILELAPKTAQLVYVGKRGEGDKTSQTHIEDLLIESARQGKCVVRLKGGDPFLFGRGGEEAEALAQAKIPFEIVPGVSSLIAAPAYAGIPLTHRDWTSTLAFATGHAQENAPHPVDWAALAKMGTIVLVMGVKTMKENCENLLKAGMAASTPVALIRWGTMPQQKTYVSTLAKVSEEVQQKKLMPPVVMVIGEVVKLRTELSWFEQKALFGKKILITRSQSQNQILAKKFETLGAEVVCLPTLEFFPPGSWENFDAALQKISSYEWLVFTSINGVEFFFERFFELKNDLRSFPKIKIACVGVKTQEALAKFYLKADFVSPGATSGQMAEEMIQRKIINGSVLLVRAQEGRDDFADLISAQNFKVDLAFTYKSLPSEKGRQILTQYSNLSAFDLLVFASSSAVKNLFALLSEAQKDAAIQTKCLCIGPTTSSTARELGFSNLVQSEKTSVESLIEKALGIFNDQKHVDA